MTNLDRRFNSDFPPHLFVIDPAGCGCTDCLTGMSTPDDQLTTDDIVVAVLGHGMTVLDRR